MIRKVREPYKITWVIVKSGVLESPLRNQSSFKVQSSFNLSNKVFFTTIQMNLSVSLPDQNPLKPIAMHNDEVRRVHISDAMKASILSYQRKYEKYLKRTIMEEHGTFNPWGLIEK